MAEKTDKKYEWGIRQVQIKTDSLSLKNALTRGPIGFFGLINYATLIPTYGEFCGSEWSAGKRTSEISLKEMQSAPVLKVPLNGIFKDSSVDRLCKVHDLAYFDAENQPNKAALIEKADDKLVAAGELIDRNTLPQAEKTYLPLMITLFKAKGITNRFFTLLETAGDKIEEQFTALQSYRFPGASPSSDFPPVKLPPTPEEAQKARELGAAIAGTISDIAKAKNIFVKVVENKAKNIVKAGIDMLFKDLKVKVNEARHKIAVEAALAQGSLVGITDPAEQNVLTYGQSTVNSQLFDENGLLKIYQDELDDLLNTDFSQYLPEVDKPKIFEIDNSRSPRIEVKPHVAAYRSIEGEGDALSRVGAGYITKTATHSIGYGTGLLFNTDFISTLQASMASGGVRPGALQLDPNPKPNRYLQDNFQFGGYDFRTGSYKLLDPTSAYIQSLSNAAALGSLASQSTQQASIDPILLDLTGQGVRMTPYSNQGVLFDMDYSGTLRRTGWADNKTGILVDSKGTDTVQDVSQMFSEYYGAQGGKNGLTAKTRFKDGYEALCSVDSDKNGVIDKKDSVWPNLKVWVDANHNGKSESGELKSLESLAISQLNLQTKPAASGEMRDGNGVRAYGSFTINGVEREALSVDFIADPTSITIRPWEEGNIITSQAITKIKNGFDGRDAKSLEPLSMQTYVSHSEKGEVVNATILGVDHLYGGNGDDTLIALEKGSWLVGGSGSNIYQGGAGDDVFVISASDDPANIHGGSGTNTVIIVGEGTVFLNMHDAQIHIAQGGAGENVITSGGGTGVYIRGGSGVNTLIGGAGDDVIVGGTGQNFIIGGSGKAVIYAGTQGDTIYGAEGDSIIHAGGGNDHIIAGPGNDVIEVGCGNARIDGGAGTNIVQFHGSYADYQIEQTAEGYIVADKILNRDGKVSVTHIQKFAFSDLSVMTLTSPLVVPVPDSLRINAQGQPFDRMNSHLITAAQLLNNDHITVDQVVHNHVTGYQLIDQLISKTPLLNRQVPLPREKKIRITEVGEAIGGQVKLTTEGHVFFTPNRQFTGVMQFKYRIADDSGYEVDVINWAKGEKTPMRAVVSLLTPDIPTDPLVTQQWYLNDANILPVWQDYTGKGIRIGMFESSGDFPVGPAIMNYEHPDLAANVDPIWLAGEKAKGSLPTIFSNHATLVAGVMVAPKNGVGIVGVAPDAKIVGYAIDSDGSELDAFKHMVSMDVINHSWSLNPSLFLNSSKKGFVELKEKFLSAVSYAVLNGRSGLGSIMICAATNGRQSGGSAQASFMNNNRFSIQVGAINAAEDLSTLQIEQPAFSNPGASILISAPGSNIISTSQMLKTDHGSVFGQAMSVTQGTSLATPIVTGVVTLMLQANPQLGYRDVQHILALSAHKINDKTTSWNDNHARNWNGGGRHVSHDYGFGEVDSRAAIRLAESWLGKNTKRDLVTPFYVMENTFPMKEGRLVVGVRLTSIVQIEHIDIDLDLSFSSLKDLTVTLISPMGTESILLNHYGVSPNDLAKGIERDSSTAEAGRLKYRFMSTHHWGERMEGLWVVKITDDEASSNTVLHSWELRFSGNEENINDTYFYTDEYANVASINTERDTLDDAVNGLPGGRNTIHAAAVSGDVNINLSTGEAKLNGYPLIIRRPEEIHNMISGDGNDVLVAHHAGAVLDGGRGVNRLTGGQGEDIFVIHRRKNGRDTLTNFNPKNGDKIYLVGFSEIRLEALVFKELGNEVNIQLQDGQTILLQNLSIPVQQIREALIMQDILTVPKAYVDSNSNDRAILVESDSVILEGGLLGLGTFDSEASFFGKVIGFGGKIYDHQPGRATKFVVAPFKEASAVGAEQLHYSNAVRGFKSEVDHIDLSKIGIKSFDDLIFRTKTYGKFAHLDIAYVEGTEILSRSLGDQRGPAILAYLDGVEPYQVVESNFIFAKDPTKPLEAINLAELQRQIETTTDTLIQQMATAHKPSILPPDAGTPDADAQRVDLAAGNDVPQLLKKPNVA